METEEICCLTIGFMSGMLIGAFMACFICYETNNVKENDCVYINDTQYCRGYSNE